MHFNVHKSVIFFKPQRYIDKVLQHPQNSTFDANYNFCSYMMLILTLSFYLYFIWITLVSRYYRSLMPIHANCFPVLPSILYSDLPKNKT